MVIENIFATSRVKDGIRVCVYEARAKELSTRMSKREKDGPLKRGAWPRDSALSEYINDGLLVWSTV